MYDSNEVCSGPPGKFVFKRWRVVIMTSGTFKSLLLVQDGGVPSLISGAHCTILGCPRRKMTDCGDQR